ncbi:hypothetical protein [Agromyces allii]|uniref:Uncharacterized protein n=1 Tax=Agromyces allii TaxID=393607 RepID=A0ABP5BX24_9MICO|nr:hypothetical protein [Agromyces allii]
MTEDQVAHGEGARGRVTFTAFSSADDPMLIAWGRFRSQLAGAGDQIGPGIKASAARTVATATAPHRPAAAAAAEERHGRGDAQASGLWRLLASNNRELGRSYLLYSSHAAARTHVQRLQAASAGLEVVIMDGPVNASHGWVVTCGGTPVMTCGRWYSSTSTSIASAMGALAALHRAVLSEDVDRTAPSRRFSRRVPMKSQVDAW